VCVCIYCVCERESVCVCVRIPLQAAVLPSGQDVSDPWEIQILLWCLPKDCMLDTRLPCKNSSANPRGEWPALTRADFFLQKAFFRSSALSPRCGEALKRKMLGMHEVSTADEAGYLVASKHCNSSTVAMMRSPPRQEAQPRRVHPLQRLR
jgi:hypothetical protein